MGKEIRQSMNGLLDGCASPDGDVLILVYELIKEKDVERPSDWCPSTPAEVEEEFARITGIRPEPLFPDCNGQWPRSQAMMMVQGAADSDETLMDKTWEARCAGEMVQQEKESQPAKKANAEKCLQGLDWSVDTTETHVQAVVSFSEAVWQTLQGSSDTDLGGRSSAAFRKAVNFELAEKELRVLHADTVVLQLRLQHTIDPDGGSAKVSGTHRRVTVSAPLCS